MNSEKRKELKSWHNHFWSWINMTKNDSGWLSYRENVKYHLIEGSLSRAIGLLSGDPSLLGALFSNDWPYTKYGFVFLPSLEGEKRQELRKALCSQFGEVFSLQTAAETGTLLESDIDYLISQVDFKEVLRDQLSSAEYYTSIDFYVDEGRLKFEKMGYNEFVQGRFNVGYLPTERDDLSRLCFWIAEERSPEQFTIIDQDDKDFGKVLNRNELVCKILDDCSIDLDDQYEYLKQSVLELLQHRNREEYW